METVTLLYEDYQKELAEDFKNTFLKRASDTDSSRSNDAVIDEVTDMLSTNIAVYTEKLLRQWGFSSGGEGGSGGGDVTVTLDDLLQKYLEDNYVTIKGDQEVYGEKDFRKGIRIAGRRLYWDESNDALVIEGAAYTTRWLSAYGMSPGGGGAGSGGAAAMYQLIDVSPNDTKDAVLGAEKDYVLTFDGNFWRGMPNKGGLSSKLFTALDKDGNEVNPDDENSEIYAIRANYSLWSVGFLSAKGISDGGAGGGGGGAVALYQLLDVEKNSDITGVAGATKGSVLTFNGDKWYADKPKTAEGINRLFSALDADGNEVDLNDESKLGTITNIRANYALWSVDWISAKGKSSGGSGGGGGLISLVYGFESLGGTFDNNDNTATFNAFTINEIWKLASSGLTNVTVTGSGNAVTDVTKGSDGRSLTFTKGNMFASKSEFDALNTKFNDFLTGSDADDIINKWSELEVFLQGMKESDNLAVILQSKMDKSAFNKLFSALDSDGNEIDPSDDTKTVAAIRANFGFWGVDYVSAKGVSKGSGGTGGASALYQLVDVLANDTGDGVDGAVAGKALVFDGTHWKAADAGLNESQLSAFLSLNGYLTQTAADGRYVTSARKVIAGTGLSGGGSLTSDVTLSLGTSGVVAGTYTKVMVDVYGRVTSGTSLSATDIPSLDWSKITTGKPTTLAGYGITDAVTLTTNQTISGQKTFTKNILMNSGIGLSYGGNIVFRNTAGNTVISSYGSEGMIYFRPNGDTSDDGVIQINKQGHLNGVSAGFTGGVSAARLTANEYIQIGDAQLVYDSANKALRVKHRTDGNTVGFYSDGWVSALGVKTGGSGEPGGGEGGLIKVVYGFADLGKTFDNSNLSNTFNAYTINEIWKLAKEGGGIKNITQSGSGNAVTNMALSSDGKTITAVFGETFARQQDFGTLNNTVTQLSNKLNNFLEGSDADNIINKWKELEAFLDGLTESDNLAELLALKADKTITISAGTGLTGGGNLSANRTLSLATTGVKAGTYTKVTVDTYGRVTVGDNPTTLAGYGITDAYSKTEADGKYVTIATAQTISGAKTFSAVTKTASVLPSADANSELGGTANRWNNIYSVNGTFSQNVTAKLLSASETLQIGDAYLKWDSTNNAVYVIKKDGTTPVGFYSTDWLSAKGVSMPGVQTGTLADLIDVEITNPTNGQALKYDAISQKWVNGTIDSFNVNQMWTELTKADSSKVIDASHIPTSVLDNRWVKKTGDTMTGALTSASSSGSIVFKGLENCDITNIYKDNGVIRNDDGGLTSIRNGLRFNWYDTYWYIGNLRGAGTNSSGFGIANESNKLCLQVTPDYTTAPVFRSSASQGTAPLIVYSTTQVSNLNADLLDDKHGAYYQNRVYDTFVSQYTKYDYIEFLRFVIPSGQNQFRAYVVFDLCRTETGNESSGRAVLRLRRNTDNTASTLFYVTNFGRNTLPELRCTSDDGITWRIWMKCNKSGYDPYIAVKIVEQYPYGYVTTQNNGTTGTPEGTRHVFTALSAGISNAANFLVNSRTLWGQPFNGTANVSGDMTGVGSITMSGDLKIGNATSPNTIYFYGTTGDGPGSYSHTFIAERIWGGTEYSELVLFKGNDLGNGTDAITVSNPGPDRIRHIAAAHLFQTYTTGLSGSVESVCTSSALKNLFSIASNRVISYVQLQSTIASGVAPFIVASNTVVSNLNADLLDGQHLSDLDGRYVNVTGDTMTGDLTMNNTKGFNIGWSTRVAKNSGVWIHGGADAASSTDANLRFASWYGIGWYPTIDTASGVRQGNNAMWLNVRYGNLNVAGGIKESTICIGRVNSSGEYDAAYNGEINRYDHHLFLQHHSGKYLIMCTGGGLAGIGTNSPGEKLHVAGNTRTDGYFRSTVGTGTQPYQCSSTTLNTNLNADLLDNWHIMDIPRNYNSTATYSLQFALGGTNNNWRKIFACSESGAGPYRSVTVWGRIWYAYGNYAQDEVRSYHFCAIFQMRGEPSASDSNVGNISNSARLYLPTFAKGMDNIRLVRVGTNNFELQVRQIGSYNNGYIQYQYWANGANVSAWRELQSTSNTSVAVSAGGASTLADSRASSADVWTTARTFYIQDYHSANTGAGVSVNGGSNCYLKLPSTTRFSRIDFSTPNANIRHSGNDNGNEVGSSTLSNLVIDSWYGVSFTTTYSSTYQNKIAMSVNCRTGRVTANNFHAATNITANGAITAKASSSDIRLKTDIQGYDAMGIIRKFRSVKYHWNAIAKENSEVFNHDNWNYGLIAQDLLSGGYSQWVKDAFNDYYTIDYERLIPVVWKGLQEVDDEVTKLKREVARLNKRVEELEKSLCA